MKTETKAPSLLKITLNQFPKIVLLFLLSIIVSGLYSQTGTIKGKIIDKETKESIPFASVQVLDIKTKKEITGAVSDYNGFYSIEGISAGVYKMKVSFVGYKEVVIKKVTVIEDTITQQDIKMMPQAEIMESVMVIEDNSSIFYNGNRRSLATKVGGVYISPVHQHNTEEYGEIVENSFLSPLYHPLSTFSIDVDMASYSNIRRFLNQGDMPPVDAVRTEEMINYFSYDYPGPQPEVPIDISTDVAGCSWKNDHKLVLIGLQAEKIETADLPPNNLVFLLDVSGSMSSQAKLPLLKKSMQLLVNNLRPQDRVAIVVYAGSSGLVLKSTRGNNKEKIMQAIDDLHAGGSTAGSEGIKLAYETAEKSFLLNGNNRVILATDGDFNVGVTSDKDLVKLIEEKRESGIFLTVLGFGQGNLKDSKMEKLADHGNGNYAYIDNLLEAQKTLVNEMGGTLLTVAKDVKIQVEFNPNKVQAYRLIGYENRLLEDEDFNDDQKDAGEIGAGKSVTALYEIIPAGIATDLDFGSVDSLKYQKVKVQDKTEFTDELLTVKVRYKLPDQRKSRLLTEALKDAETAFADASNNLQFAASVAEFAMLLRESEFSGTSSYDHLIDIATRAKGADTEGYRAEFVRLVKLAREIEISSMESRLEE